MDYNIRSILPSDHVHVLSLIREFAVFQKTPEDVHNSLERMSKEQEYLTGLIVEYQDTPVAFATYYTAYSSWTGKTMHLDDLYVQSQHRGKGIGKKLMDTVIDISRKEQCHDLRWMVSEWNKEASEFYEHIGAQINTIDRLCKLKL